jgi:hypothetical protein
MMSSVSRVATRSAQQTTALRLTGLPLAIGIGVAALGIGLLVSIGAGLPMVGLFILAGFVTWAAPRPAALAAVLLGIAIIPTPALAEDKFHGVPAETLLDIVTLCGAAVLWWDRSKRAARPKISPYALGALMLIIVAAIVQLGTSKYSDVKPVYQLGTAWLAGLLLGSILAADSRMLRSVGVLAAPLAVLSVLEYAAGKPNLWGQFTGANEFASLATSGGDLRSTSTFGHPLVAGASLVVLAFMVIVKPSRRSSILFAVILAGAIVTVSRSALIGLAVGGLIYFLGGRRRRSAIFGAVATTAVVTWLLLTLIPSLATSIESRVLDASTRTQSIRLNSLHTLGESISDGNSEIITGRGIDGSLSYLSVSGGNLGFVTYDNQYVTSIYDSGILVVIAAFGLIALALARARPSARLVAPLAACAATMFFFEGLYWPITGLLFWMSVGLATAPRPPDGDRAAAFAVR